MKNVVTRYLTALVISPVLLIMILYSPVWFFDTVSGLVLVIVLYEWLTIASVMKLPVPRFFGMVLGIINLVLVFLYARSDTGFYPFFAIIISGAGVCWYFILSHTENMERTSLAMSTLFFSIFMVCWGGGSVMLLRDFEPYPDGRHLIVLLLSISWIGDAGAMHFGKWFGRHKLSPVISPNKTIEGLAGAIITGAIGGGIAYWLCQLRFPIWHMAVLVPSLIILSHTGDLMKSIFKRAAMVKDSGNWIPGHGGFLDRLDNILLTAPFLYIFARLLWA